MSKDSTKSKNIYRMPGKLWKLLKKHLPKEPKVKMPGRPQVKNRDVLDGIWHVLWTRIVQKPQPTENRAKKVANRPLLIPRMVFENGELWEFN